MPSAATLSLSTNGFNLSLYGLFSYSWKLLIIPYDILFCAGFLLKITTFGQYYSDVHAWSNNKHTCVIAYTIKIFKRMITVKSKVYQKQHLYSHKVEVRLSAIPHPPQTHLWYNTRYMLLLAKKIELICKTR